MLNTEHLIYGTLHTGEHSKTGHIKNSPNCTLNTVQKDFEGKLGETAVRVEAAARRQHSYYRNPESRPKPGRFNLPTWKLSYLITAAAKTLSHTELKT